MGCSCSGLSFNCQSLNLNDIPTNINRDIRSLNLDGNRISHLNMALLEFPFLFKLNISGNSITQMRSNQFKHLHNLMILDLGYNNLQSIPSDCFTGLNRLKKLILTGNHKLAVLVPGSFHGLSELPSLILKSMSINHIESLTFSGLPSLLTLDLSNNKLHSMGSDVFFELVLLKRLDISLNPIKEIPRTSFFQLPSLEFLNSSSFKFCCLAENVKRSNCFPPQDAISSCKDLMRNNVLRSFIWILGLMALLGNIFVILWRIQFPSRGTTDIIINNLAVSDMLMGFYMIIIASVDAYYKGVFIEYSDQWRDHWMCTLAGFLATFSTEGSVLFLCLLTGDRFLNIMFPFGVKLTKGSIQITASCLWILAFCLSALPMVPIDYFGDSFYGRSGVCLALPLTNEHPPGWQYSSAVFIGFNLVGFFVIALGYSVMYVAINRSSTQATGGGLKRLQQITLARKMMIIVLTDFVCWLPIIAMGKDYLLIPNT